jgi:hypothetical protein
MLVSGGISQERLGEAFAQFALSHPMTYSAEALKVAVDLLTPEPADAAEGERDEGAEAARPGSNWWRRCARRASCH